MARNNDTTRCRTMLRLGGVSMGRCPSETLPGMTVCADHADREAMAHWIVGLARRLDVASGKVEDTDAEHNETWVMETLKESTDKWEPVWGTNAPTKCQAGSDLGDSYRRRYKTRVRKYRRVED